MQFRGCSAVACGASIGIGASFCNHHWSMIPSQTQMSIAGYAALIKRGRGDTVQHRFVYAILDARARIAKAERRRVDPVAPAYKANAEAEAAREKVSERQAA